MVRYSQGVDFLINRTDEKHPSLTGGLVGVGTVVVGDIVFSGGLRIDGEIRGNVRALDNHSATLVIGEKGCVDGTIEVTNVVINGLVTGRIYAKQLVALRSKAQVRSDVEYDKLEMQLGAVIQGRLLRRQHVAQIVESQEAVRIEKLESMVASL